MTANHPEPSYRLEHRVLVEDLQDGEITLTWESDELPGISEILELNSPQQAAAWLRANRQTARQLIRGLAPKIGEPLATELTNAVDAQEYSAWRAVVSSVVKAATALYEDEPSVIILNRDPQPYTGPQTRHGPGRSRQPSTETIKLKWRRIGFSVFAAQALGFVAGAMLGVRVARRRR